MKKLKFILFFSVILLFISPSFAVSGSKLISSCERINLNESNFLNWVEGQTLKNLSDFIVDIQIGNNFETDIIFDIKLEEGFGRNNLKITYKKEEVSLFGDGRTFGAYFSQRDPKSIFIYTKNIRNFLNGTIFDSEPDFKNRVHNTLKHEIIHYLDDVYGLEFWKNYTQVFGINSPPVSNLLASDKLIFTQAQKNLSSSPFPLNPLYWGTLDFERLYNISLDWYDPEDNFDESIARTTAVCLNFFEWNASKLSYLGEPTFCNNFNYNNVNFNILNELSQDMFIQFYLDEFPEQNFITPRGTKLCKISEDIEKDYFFIISQIMSKFTDFYTQNFIILLIIIPIGAFIGAMIQLILNKVKESIKNK